MLVALCWVRPLLNVLAHHISLLVLTKQRKPLSSAFFGYIHLTGPCIKLLLLRKSELLFFRYQFLFVRLSVVQKRFMFVLVEVNQRASSGRQQIS